jgi:hypothetical protein
LNGLEDFLNKFRGRRSSSITSIEFQSDDIQREEVVKEVLDIYENECIPPAYRDDPLFISTKNEMDSASDLSDDIIQEEVDYIGEPDVKSSEVCDSIVKDVVNLLAITVENSV